MHTNSIYRSRLGALVAVLAFSLAIFTFTSSPVQATDSDDVSFSYELRQGWNNVSPVIVEMLGETITDFFPNATDIFIHENGYRLADTFSTGKGYWINNSVAETIEVTGSSTINSFTFSTEQAGTYYIGSPFVMDLSDVECVTSAYWYNPETTEYEQFSTTIEGSAHWIGTEGACTFTKNRPPAGDMGITAPTQGSVWTLGRQYNITWDLPPVYAPLPNGYIDLIKDNTVIYSIASGTIDLTDESYAWTISLPADVMGDITGALLHIRVSTEADGGGLLSATSDAFYIEEPVFERADLLIKEVEYKKQNATHILQVTVCNDGNLTTSVLGGRDFVIASEADDDAMALKKFPYRLDFEPKVGSIAANTCENVGMISIPASEIKSDTKLIVYVDTKNQISESNENNNSYTYLITSDDVPSPQTRLYSLWSFDAVSMRPDAHSAVDGQMVLDSGDGKVHGVMGTSRSHDSADPVVVLESSGRCIAGDCLLFDGQDDYVDLGINNYIHQNKGSFSINLWARGYGYQDPYRNSRGAFFGWMGFEPMRGVGFGPNDEGDVSFWLPLTHSSLATLALDDVHDDSTWAQWTVVYDKEKAEMSVFKNGALLKKQTVDLADVTGLYTDNGISVKIGDRGDGLVNMRGLMDEVAYYSYALDVTDIEKLYNKYSTRAVDVSRKPENLAMVSDSNDSEYQQRKKYLVSTAELLTTAGVEPLLEERNKLRDLVREQQDNIKYLQSLLQESQALNARLVEALNGFITYGVDDNTEKLGAGERAAVVNSYKHAFGRLPENESELSDLFKIANGFWPDLKNSQAEAEAKKLFRTIYKRDANVDNPNDSAAITVMAYGLRQQSKNRNLESEKQGIRIFRDIFGRTPDSTLDWNTMQAITYSGATRNVVDTDGDGLSDAMEDRYGSDKNNPDTDGDGYKDGHEIVHGYSPLE